MRLVRCSQTLRQLLQSDVGVSIIVTQCLPISDPDADAGRAAMMAGPGPRPPQFGRPSNSCCPPPNLLGGSSRTTAPGCIRPLSASHTCRQDDSRVLADTSRVAASLISDDFVDLLDQHSACEPSHAAGAMRELSYGIGRQTVGTSGRRCVEAMKHDNGFVEHKHCVSGSDVTAGISSKQDIINDRYNFLQLPSSQTLSSDVLNHQSFHISSSKSPNIIDDVENQAHGVSVFISRVSFQSLRRLLIASASTDASRGRSSSCLSDSSCYDYDCPSALKASAACSARSNDSSSSSAMTIDVQSPIRRWFGRLRWRGVPRYIRSGITTVTSKVSDVPLTTVVRRDVTTDTASCVVKCRETEVAEAENQDEETVEMSGTVDGCGGNTISERHSQSTGILRVLQPPTTLDLPVPRDLMTSPGHCQVRRRGPMSSYRSSESIGQCSVDFLASTDAG